ncbi:MAG TPA: MqnA/MqnD/SBP family protein [Gaiellaceae bacterium]|nr:MqnA/MqnD/SBP family protein [Gaiellaceae bacterium]
MLVRIGHSADPDDAFMVWGLATGNVDARGFEFDLVPEDIQVLNEWALEGRLEVTALSMATYPLVEDRYDLLPHGASIGSGYGPIVVSREPLTLAQLRDTEVVVPGRLTTAFRVLGMALGPDFPHRTLAFDRILDEVKWGRADAGLLIHEGQLTYADEGLEKVLDLGEWWLLETGLPLPLGVNVVRRDVPRRDVLSDVLLDSINAGLAHREQATRYALTFARDLAYEDATQFIDMYVNELTCDYGDEGRKAVEEFLRRVRA